MECIHRLHLGVCYKMSLRYSLSFKKYKTRSSKHAAIVIYINIVYILVTIILITVSYRF